MITTSSVQSFIKQASPYPGIVTKGINIGADKLGVEPEDRGYMTLGAIPGALLGNRLMRGRGILPQIAGTLGGGLGAAMIAPSLVAGIKKALTKTEAPPMAWAGDLNGGKYGQWPMDGAMKGLGF